MAKKKKRNTVIVLLAVLIAVCGAYFGVQKYNEAQEARETEEDGDASIPVIALEDVAAVSYDNEKASLSFEKQEDTWVNTEKEDFPLMQNRINSIANAMKDLSASRKLEDVEDLAQYGLDSVTKTVTAKDSSGNEKTLKIGAVNEYTGDYYAMVDGDDAVYTISDSLVNYTDYTLEDLQQLDTVIAVTSDQANQVTLLKGGTQMTFEKKDVEAQEETAEETEAEQASSETAEETGEADATEETETAAAEQAWFEVTDAGETQLTEEEETSLDAAIDAAGSASVDSCVNYKVEGEDRAQYGLDEASETVITISFTAADEEGTSTLHVGNLDETGAYYYVGVGDSKAVNLVEKESLDAIFEVLN